MSKLKAFLLFLELIIINAVSKMIVEYFFPHCMDTLLSSILIGWGLAIPVLWINRYDRLVKYFASIL